MRSERNKSFAMGSELAGKAGDSGYGMIIFFGMLMLAGYLFTINLTAVEGYAFRNAEREIEAAKAENQKLRIQEAELISLGRIEEAKDRLGLVQTGAGTDDVAYIDAGGNSLALR